MSDAEIKALEAKIGNILDRITKIETMLNERCDNRSERIEELEDRVKKLELSQAKVIGAAAALSLFLNYVLKGLGVQ